MKNKDFIKEYNKLRIKNFADLFYFELLDNLINRYKIDETITNEKLVKHLDDFANLFDKKDKNSKNLSEIKDFNKELENITDKYYTDKDLALVFFEFMTDENTKPNIVLKRKEDLLYNFKKYTNPELIKDAKFSFNKNEEKEKEK